METPESKKETMDVSCLKILKNAALVLSKDELMSDDLLIASAQAIIDRNKQIALLAEALRRVLVTEGVLKEGEAPIAHELILAAEQYVSKFNQSDHCDDVVMQYKQPECLRWFLFINRLPAVLKELAGSMGIKPELYANYQGKRVKVVMVSRFGDVGITEDLTAVQGYSERVKIKDLTDFSPV